MVASNRIRAWTADPAVWIELRIPGPWRSAGALMDALEAADLDYRFEEGQLVRASDDWRCELGSSPHDDAIADLFAYEGRMSRKEIAAVAKHVSKVHLRGPGGSVNAARAMVDAATALVKLGAAGVMVDNSGATHSPADWMALAEDREPGGLYWAFTVLTAGDEAAWTIGQHCLGLRDAELLDPPDDQFAYLLVHNFLGYVYQSGRTVHDGDVIDGPGGTIYRATQHPFTRVEPGSPFHNPFGLWRLQRVVEGEVWAKECYHAIR